jgi:hypothetical protein
MALPLPLYACWAHLLMTAAHLQHWDVAKHAAAVLLPRFIATSPSRPLWQAHPMDRHQLQLQQVQNASPTLLRLLVQAVYVYAQHVGEQQQQQQRLASAGISGAAGGSGSGLAGTAASRVLLLQLSDSRVPQQMGVLESCKKLMASMQVKLLACLWREKSACMQGLLHAAFTRAAEQLPMCTCLHMQFRLGITAYSC